MTGVVNNAIKEISPKQTLGSGDTRQHEQNVLF